MLRIAPQSQVMILTLDKEKGRVSLSTKKLEPTPGDMVRDPNLVFSRADEMAAAFRWGLPFTLALSQPADANVSCAMQMLIGL